MKEHWNSKTEGISMTLGGKLAILFYVVLYNRMMAYVESRAYRAAPAPENKRKAPEITVF